MGIVFRQSVKSSIATLAGAVLGALVIYLSTRYIPKQELGFRNILTNYSVVGGQILLVGLHNTLAVYIHRYTPSDKRYQALITISLLMPFVFITGAGAVYFLLKDDILSLFNADDVRFVLQYFAWLPVFTLLFAYSVLLETYLISQLKVAKATFIREVLLRLLNIMLILFFGLGYISYDVLIYGTVLLYLIPIGLLLAIALKTDGFRLSFNWGQFEHGEKREIIHFTWYHSLLSVSISLMGMLDTLMIPTLSKTGLRSVPVYVVSVFLISFLLIPYRAMLNSTFALLAQAFKANDREKVSDIFMRSSLNIFIASGAMFLLIVCNLHNAVALLPNGYEGITTIVVILAAGRMVDMVTGMNDQALSLSSYYKYNFYISLLLVVLMSLFNWWLIPVYDVNGAAAGTSLALIVYNIIKLIVVKRKLHIQPLNKKTLLVLLAGAAAFVAGYYLPRLKNPFIDTIYRSAVIFPLYAVLLLILRPSEDLNNYLASVRRNKRIF